MPAGLAAVGKKLLARLPAGQRAPAALTGLTVLSEIGYPLTSGIVRDRLTLATVLLWSSASLSHAAATRGRRFAAGLLATTAGLGFAAEAIGVATGWPFGTYTYADSLGPRLAGVPIVIPLAWTMMAYPALLAGHRLGSPVVGGALALACWDLFLDPQMVAAGHWSFTGSGLRINGIPVTNTLGWLLVSLAIIAGLDRLQRRAGVPAGTADDRLMHALYLWTYASSVLASAVFFHRPAVALVGGLGMGIPAGLLARALRTPARARPPRSTPPSGRSAASAGHSL